MQLAIKLLEREIKSKECLYEELDKADAGYYRQIQPLREKQEEIKEHKKAIKKEIKQLMKELEELKEKEND